MSNDNYSLAKQRSRKIGCKFYSLDSTFMLYFHIYFCFKTQGRICGSKTWRWDGGVYHKVITDHVCRINCEDCVCDLKNQYLCFLDSYNVILRHFIQNSYHDTKWSMMIWWHIKNYQRHMCLKVEASRPSDYGIFLLKFNLQYGRVYDTDKV